MTELNQLKEQFISNLLECIPKEYILGYQWWEQAEWIKVYSRKTELAFDVEGWETAKEPSCIWKSRTTHAFNLQGIGTDFSDIPLLDSADLLDEFPNAQTDCFIAIDFQIPLESSKYFLQLQLPKTMVVDIGLFYLLEDLNQEHRNQLEYWCLVNNGTAWLFFELGFKNIVFSNFSIPSLHCFEDVEVAQRKIKVDCMDYLHTFLTPIYCPKSTYLSEAIDELQRTLRDQYISSFGDGFDTLDIDYFDLMKALKSLVDCYGYLSIGYKETIQSYVVNDLKGWQYALSDPMSSYKEACNQYARWLEDEWFWNTSYETI
ncbi:MAG: hypothetical protein ACRBFS_02255 [Aureispira sp.]